MENGFFWKQVAILLIFLPDSSGQEALVIVPRPVQELSVLLSGKAEGRGWSKVKSWKFPNANQCWASTALWHRRATGMGSRTATAVASFSSSYSSHYICCLPHALCMVWNAIKSISPDRNRCTWSVLVFSLELTLFRVALNRGENDEGETKQCNETVSSEQADTGHVVFIPGCLMTNPSYNMLYFWHLLQSVICGEKKKNQSILTSKHLNRAQFA